HAVLARVLEIPASALFGDGAQRLLHQTTHDRRAAGALQVTGELPVVRVVGRDLSARRCADADRVDARTLQLAGFGHIAVGDLTIGDEHDGALPQRIEIRRKRAECGFDAGPKRRSLYEPHAATGIVEDLTEDARIGRRWVPDRALTGEEHEGHTAADHLPPELFREVPRRPQAIGFDVARRHALRDVDRK